MVIEPLPIVHNEIAIVTYNGFLTNFNDNRIYVYYSFGLEAEWKQGYQKKMKLIPYGYRTSIFIDGLDILKLCFHDDQGHWDNNKGKDWTVNILL